MGTKKRVTKKQTSETNHGITEHYVEYHRVTIRAIHRIDMISICIEISCIYKHRGLFIFHDVFNRFFLLLYLEMSKAYDASNSLPLFFLLSFFFVLLSF